MRITLLIVILLLLLCFNLMPIQAMAESSAYFDIDLAVEMAERNDLELGKLKVSFRELLRSKANLYRGMLPKLKANISGSKSVLAEEADTSTYSFGLTLEQVLYDQFSGPIKIREYYNSIDNARIKIKQREKQIEADVTGLYLSIIFGERALVNSKEEIGLYEKLVELMGVEYRLGSKTLIDVVESEKKLLEAKLEREEMSQSKGIAYRDLVGLLDIDSEKVNIIFDHSIEKIYYRVFKDSSINSVDSLVDSLKRHFGLSDLNNRDNKYRDVLYSKAMENDYGIKMLKVQLRNNELQRRLNNLLWLKNISVNCGASFSGDKFFPVNRTYTLGLDVLFDFGFFAPEVSVTGSKQSTGNTLTGTTESDLFNEAPMMNSLVNRKRALNIKAHNLKKQLENRRKRLKRDIDVWLIRMNGLTNKYDIYSKQREVITKNESIILLKREIGELKDIEYLQFLIEKRDFNLKMDELSRDIIKLAWEFESITNMKIYEYWRLKNSVE